MKGNGDEFMLRFEKSWIIKHFPIETERFNVRFLVHTSLFLSSFVIFVIIESDIQRYIYIYSFRSTRGHFVIEAGVLRPCRAGSRRREKE